MSKDKDILEVLERIENNISSLKEDLNEAIKTIKDDREVTKVRKMERAIYR